MSSRDPRGESRPSLLRSLGTGYCFDPLLKDVSRSFYLSLRLLPCAVRGSLSLAYLLARASDTIADAIPASIEDRLKLFESLPKALPHCPAVPGAEGRLLAMLPELLDAWDDSPDRDAIGGVWEKIRDGQMFDLQRFGGPAPPPLTPGELEHYTYLVAGSVGEFWTTLCFKHVRGYSTETPERMLQLGKCFGQGLQLVNILRDVRADDAIGRAYIPTGRVAQEMDLARQHLAAGARYSSAVLPRRLRAACLLPLFLGRATLDLVESHPGQTRCKVPRLRVWGMLLKALLAPAGPADVQRRSATAI